MLRGDQGVQGNWDQQGAKVHDLFVEFGRSVVDHEVFFFDDMLSVFVQQLV